MKKIALLCLLAVIAGLHLFSQDLTDSDTQKWTRFINVDGGVVFPNGTIKDDIPIRQDVSSYQSFYPSSGTISTFTKAYHMSIRAELFNNIYNLGLSTGIRLLAYDTELSGYTHENADFFYLRYAMNDGDTKFARVQSITENKMFLTVPLELRYMPLRLKNFGFFMRAGAELSVMSPDAEIDLEFYDSQMKVFKNEVAAGLTDDTNSFYSSFYGAVGITFGQKDKLNYSMEVFIPSPYLTDNNFMLSTVDFYSGFKFSLQMPF